MWSIVVLGLGLRILSAQGALWLDEAWSAVLAREAGTPIGIFVQINHDNNHHLNSLWMQFVGLDAPPMLARALSIVSGTIAIYVAALIGSSRGRLVALVTALLFAISPVLVTLGSEARGYAPMVLALLIAVRLVGRALAEGTDTAHRPALALCFGLGALSQLTMIFGICAIVGWTFLAFWRRTSFAEAMRRTLRLLGPALVTLAIVLGALAAAALSSTAGFRFGSYEPFALLMYLHAIVEILGYTVGLPWNDVWWLAIAPALVVLARPLGASRLEFYWLAIIGFPLMLAILHAGNVGHPRYYLVAALALLLLIAEMIGVVLAAGGWRRWIAAAALAMIALGSAVQDVDLIVNQRGDPGGAIAAMAGRAPQGAEMHLDRDTGLAMIQVAAEQARYRLRIVNRDCPAPRFALIDRFKGEPFPTSVVHCGTRYRPIAGARARGLSGTHWTLYEATR